MAFSNWYYGMDDASSPPFPCAGDGPNFYLGRLGKGTKSDGEIGFPYFNKDSAKLAGNPHTFPIWVLEGPGNAPAGVDPQDWGWNQADSLSSALGDSAVSGLIGGKPSSLTLNPEAEVGRLAIMIKTPPRYLAFLTTSRVPMPATLLAASISAKIIGINTSVQGTPARFLLLSGLPEARAPQIVRPRPTTLTPTTQTW